jgi:predicted AAA+ superfamily ATPase
MASPCGASRQTLANYLKVLEETGAVHVIRPFAQNSQREITAMPKVCGFDTGFVCHSKGWRDLRPEDTGLLWEHLVLDELKARFAKGDFFIGGTSRSMNLTLWSPREAAVPWRWSVNGSCKMQIEAILHPF